MFRQPSLTDCSCFPWKPSSRNPSLLGLVFWKEKLLGGFAQLAHKEHRNTSLWRAYMAEKQLGAGPWQAAGKSCCASSFQPGSKRNLTTCAESKLFPWQFLLAWYFPGWCLLAPACAQPLTKGRPAARSNSPPSAAQPIRKPAPTEGPEAWSRPLPCRPEEKPQLTRILPRSREKGCVF